MKKQKFNLLAYGLLLASIFGTLVDRPSKALRHTTGSYTLETLHWQDGDDEFTILATRFLFPEKPGKPAEPLASL